MYRYLIICILLCSSFSATANFDFNQNCVRAYNHILCLRLSNARNLIAAEKKKNPQNAIPYLLDNYVDYFTLLTTESRPDFERLKNNKSARLDRIESDDQKSPYYLFAQAEINLQCALIRGRFHEYVTSAFEINKAYSLLKENAEKYPGFLPNQKNIGMINALLGSMPDGLKRTLSAFGIRGNTAKDVIILNYLAAGIADTPYAFFYDEVVFYLAYIQTDIIHDPAAYAKIIRNTESIDPSSLLKTYLRSYAGMKTAHNDEAIETLLGRPSGAAYQPYPYLDYLSGVAKTHQLDQQAARYFQSYLHHYRGINHVKDAYLHLAWLELLDNNSNGYRNYIEKVKTKGNTYHEKDKQALNEANDATPDLVLLKARLLFDGGYYARALQVIQTKKIADLKNIRDRTEYYYRMARIYDETGKHEMAIRFYQSAVNSGRNERYYFASNAAYRIGMIYEKLKNYSRARSMYTTAIAMKNHDYESSIENKAKEGLKRVK